MAWARMRFRDDLVWVKVDDQGAPVLDADGRAEMRYRPEDTRSYRPHPGNLTPAPAGGAAQALTPGAPPGERAPRPARPARRSSTRPGPRAPDRGPATHRISIWTDGACTGNPGPMGIGVVVSHGDRRIEHGEFLGHGTNNVAELTAIARGLELAERAFPDLVHAPDSELRVYTDSSYGIGVLSLGWKARANQDLVARLRRELQRFPRVVFEKVAGHAGIPDNERCDELARQAIRAGR